MPGANTCAHPPPSGQYHAHVSDEMNADGSADADNTKQKHKYRVPFWDKPQSLQYRMMQEKKYDT